MIVTCPRCAVSASISATVPVLVTCPRAACGLAFVAVPGGGGALIEAELREIAFRCAVTAKRYFIVFGRLAKTERYSVRKIHGQEGWLKRALAARHDRAAAVLDQQMASPLAAPPSVLLLVGQALLGARKNEATRATGTALVVVADTDPREARLPTAGWQRLSAEEIVRRLAPAARDDAPFNTAEFDFADFRCLHCASPPKALFVRCERCRELVCMGRGDVRSDGHADVHRCTAACGSSGPVVQMNFGMKGDQHRLPVSQSATRALGLDRQPRLGSPGTRQIESPPDGPRRIGKE